jgi:hypothetical protein
MVIDFSPIEYFTLVLKSKLILSCFGDRQIFHQKQRVFPVYDIRSTAITQSNPLPFDGHCTLHIIVSLYLSVNLNKKRPNNDCTVIGSWYTNHVCWCMSRKHVAFWSLWFLSFRSVLWPRQFLLSIRMEFDCSNKTDRKFLSPREHFVKVILYW